MGHTVQLATHSPTFPTYPQVFTAHLLCARPCSELQLTQKSSGRRTLPQQQQQQPGVQGLAVLGTHLRAESPCPGRGLGQFAVLQAVRTHDAGSLCDPGQSVPCLSFLICSGEKGCAHGSLVSWAQPKALCTLQLHPPCTQLAPGPPLPPGVASVVSTCAVSRPQWKRVGRRVEGLYQRPGLGEAQHCLCCSSSGHSPAPTPQPEQPSTHATHHQALGRTCDPPAHSQG